MDGTVSRYGADRFGSDSARPRIVGWYSADAGWNRATGPSVRLTVETARELLERGCSRVQARWRFRTHEVSLRRYLGG